MPLENEIVLPNPFESLFNLNAVTFFDIKHIIACNLAYDYKTH